jgi:hypothetical protein
VHTFHLSSPGNRPPFYDLAQHLWGIGCNVDSDGNSSSPDATDWTELTLRSRSNDNARIDVDPVGHTELLVLSIRSENEELASRAAMFSGMSQAEIWFVSRAFQACPRFLYINVASLRFSTRGAMPV